MKLRAAGWLTRRLSDVRDTAIAEAERLNHELDSWRSGMATPTRPDTLPWLMRLYRTDERFEGLAPATKRSYEQCLVVIEAWSARAGHPPIASLERQHVKAFYRSMAETPSKANAVLRVLRLLLAFAVDEGLLDRNPAERPRLKTTPPRQQVWPAEAIQKFVAAAKSAGRPSLGLAVLLGANLGQREGDILKLSWSQFDGSAITLRQGKTGVLLAVPAAKELRLALDGMSRQSPTILICETTNRTWKPDFFRHEFRRIADIAGLSNLQFLDLRRTSVVRLAEAGCTVPEIAAITGHQLDRTARILETYLPRNAPMARAAIRKLDTHRKRTKLDD